MKLIVTLLLLSAAVVSFAADAKDPEAPAAYAEAPAALGKALAVPAAPAAPCYAPAGGASLVNLSIGHIGPNDRQLHVGYVYYQGVANSVRYEDTTYRGTMNNRISAIRAYEVGTIQYASLSLFQGGPGYNYATVRVQSTWGKGYYCFIEFYGQ